MLIDKPLQEKHLQYLCLLFFKNLKPGIYNFKNSYKSIGKKPIEKEKKTKYTVINPKINSYSIM